MNKEQGMMKELGIRDLELGSGFFVIWFEDKLPAIVSVLVVAKAINTLGYARTALLSECSEDVVQIKKASASAEASR